MISVNVLQCTFLTSKDYQQVLRFRIVLNTGIIARLLTNDLNL